MGKHLLLAATALVIAAPAVAKDHSPYIGADLGIVWTNSQTIVGSTTFNGPVVCNALPPATCTAPGSFAERDVGLLHYKGGLDVDLIGGYDFGMFRLEGELGYKHGHTKHATFDSTFISNLNTAAGTAFGPDTKFNISDKSSAWDFMVNGWLDFGGETGIGGGVGAGLGYADVNQFGHSNGKLAWQLLAQVYYPVSSGIDIGTATSMRARPTEAMRSLFLLRQCAMRFLLPSASVVRQRCRTEAASRRIAFS
jgi:opacity protein-like surface antigen